MKTQYLINETPLVVLPSLMKAFNGNYTKALILQQVHFMCSWRNSGVEHDGERWVWFTYDGFAEQFMPWLSARNVQKNVLELEKDGLLVSTTRLRDSWDNTKFYRVDESAISRMVEGDAQHTGDEDTGTRTVEGALECTVDATPECTFLYTHQSTHQSSNTPQKRLSPSERDRHADSVLKLLAQHYKSSPLGSIRNQVEAERRIDEHVDLVETYGWETYVRALNTAIQWKDVRYASNVEAQIVRDQKQAEAPPQPTQSQNLRGVVNMTFRN